MRRHAHAAHPPSTFMCAQQGGKVVDRLEGADPPTLSDKVMAELLLL